MDLSLAIPLFVNENWRVRFPAPFSYSAIKNELPTIACGVTIEADNVQRPLESVLRVYPDAGHLRIFKSGLCYNLLCGTATISIVTVRLANKKLPTIAAECSKSKSPNKKRSIFVRDICFLAQQFTVIGSMVPTIDDDFSPPKFCVRPLPRSSPTREHLTMPHKQQRERREPVNRQCNPIRMSP
jgi:hypothetical protein